MHVSTCMHPYNILCEAGFFRVHLLVEGLLACDTSLFLSRAKYTFAPICVASSPIIVVAEQGCVHLIEKRRWYVAFSNGTRHFCKSLFTENHPEFVAQLPHQNRLLVYTNKTASVQAKFS